MPVHTNSVRARQRQISLYAIIAFFFVLFLSFPFDRTVIRVNALQVQHRSIATLWLRLRKNKENNNNSKMQRKMPLHIAYFICSFAVVYIYAGTLVCFDVACIKNATPAMPTHTLLRIPKTLPRKTSDHPYKICHICIWFVCLSIQTLWRAQMTVLKRVNKLCAVGMSLLFVQLVTHTCIHTHKHHAIFFHTLFSPHFCAFCWLACLTWQH